MSQAMRVRVIRAPDPTSSDLRIAVQRWSSGQWEHVTYFGMNQSEEAGEFAMKLSMTKRVPVELAVFEDGKKVEPRKIPPRMYHIESHQGTYTEQVPEKQP